ncbi:MAG: SDR family oxidoreductase [Oligoflexia bacterium]|nr:SDR family oxidoreductase [Oligoflexia bacterium]
MEDRKTTNRSGSWLGRLGGGLIGVIGVAAWRGRSRARKRRMKLAGRRVLIAGGSRGLGLALAKEFSRRGARVGILARSPDELARAQEGDPALRTYSCDLTLREETRRTVAQAAQELGGLDVLVNCAGVIQVGAFESMNERDFATLGLLRPGARIVNITSIGGTVAVPHLLPYCASKFAVVGFSLGLRTELLKSGIRVVTIVPWLMRTGSFIHAFFKGQREREFRLFSLAAVLPITAMSAERTARRIVGACEEGRAFRVIGLQARIARLGYAVFPGLASGFLGAVNRALPGYAGERSRPALPGTAHRGWRLRNRAGRRLNEVPPATSLDPKAHLR